MMTRLQNTDGVTVHVSDDLAKELIASGQYSKPRTKARTTAAEEAPTGTSIGALTLPSTEPVPATRPGTPELQTDGGTTEIGSANIEPTAEERTMATTTTAAPAPEQDGGTQATGSTSPELSTEAGAAPAATAPEPVPATTEASTTTVTATEPAKASAKASSKK